MYVSVSSIIMYCRFIICHFILYSLFAPYAGAYHFVIHGYSYPGLL